MAHSDSSSTKAAIIQKSVNDVVQRSQKQHAIRQSPERYRSVKSKVGQNLRTQKSVKKMDSQSITEHAFKNFLAQSEVADVQVTGKNVNVTMGNQRSMSKSMSKSTNNLSPIRQRAIEQSEMRNQ